MTMSGKEFVKLLLQNGWTLDRIASSHHIMIKGEQTLSVPVHAGKDLPTGLFNKLVKQAGLKL